MLKDDLEIVRKKNPGILETKTGACRYCGQMRSMELPKCWGENTCDEIATELCDCSEAGIYAMKKGQKERAAKAIEKQFGTNADHPLEEKVKELLHIMVDHIVEGRIHSGTVDVGNGLKAKLQITAKGAVKVEKSRTEKMSEEA